VAMLGVRVHNGPMRVTQWTWVVLALFTSCKGEPVASESGAVASIAAEGLTKPLNSSSKVGEELTVGEPAPDVELLLHDSRALKLSELKGRAVVLYFYPKDDTPGCRVEAQGFRDLHAEFLAANTRVFGVSTQDEGSHRAFIQKENLPFDLVIDREGTLAAAFGVPMMGSMTARQTVLIDAAGKLAAKWVDVTPKTHAAEVLAAAKMSGAKP
jgi:thioredoxin-dependent peroxiredoxin